jgi:hypothetical protein
MGMSVGWAVGVAEGILVGGGAVASSVGLDTVWVAEELAARAAAPPEAAERVAGEAKLQPEHARPSITADIRKWAFHLFTGK